MNLYLKIIWHCHRLWITNSHIFAVVALCQTRQINSFEMIKYLSSRADVKNWIKESTRNSILSRHWTHTTSNIKSLYFFYLSEESLLFKRTWNNNKHFMTLSFIYFSLTLFIFLMFQRKFSSWTFSHLISYVSCVVLTNLKKVEVFHFKVKSIILKMFFHLLFFSLSLYFL
jgi:hypothetical protein